MSRNHFIRIANAINKCTNGIVCIDKKTFIDEMISIFKRDNPNFDESIFIDYIERTSKSKYSHSLSREGLKQIEMVMSKENL